MKNIVFIMMDQLRQDFLGCYGASHINTPNIDQLALEGIRYDQCISPSPLCVPARASLLTGRSSLANRVVENSSWLRPDHDTMGIETWAKQLSDKGYYTNAIGKMHFYPWDIKEGFKERIIAEDKRHTDIEDDYSKFLNKNGYKRMHGNEFEGYFQYKGAIVNTLPEELQIDYYVKTQTCHTIRNLKKGSPFALMVGFPGPHCPYDPTKEMLGKIQDEMPTSIPDTKESNVLKPICVDSNKRSWNGIDYTDFNEIDKKKLRKHYSALIKSLDNHVGDIIQSLKDRGLYEDTVIVLSSDHGDLMGDFSLIGKHFFYESSIKVPLIVKHPNKKPNIVKGVVSLTDLYATFLSFGGIQVEETTDSTILKPFGSSQKREPIFGATDIGWMIRDDRFKYCIYSNGLEVMYDIQEDPNEQHNLIFTEKYKKVKNEMTTLLYQRLFKAITQGNEDLKVMTPNISSNFYKENWIRNYPAKI